MNLSHDHVDALSAAAAEEQNRRCNKHVTMSQDTSPCSNDCHDNMARANRI